MRGIARCAKKTGLQIPIYPSVETVDTDREKIDKILASLMGLSASEYAQLNYKIDHVRQWKMSTHAIASMQEGSVFCRRQRARDDPCRWVGFKYSLQTLMHWFGTCKQGQSKSIAGYQKERQPHGKKSVTFYQTLQRFFRSAARIGLREELATVCSRNA